MKIATFNINNINKRFACLAAWLEAAAPDVVCLQELKCEQEKFPAIPLRDLGYETVWKGQRSWNGVAISRAISSSAGSVVVMVLVLPSRLLAHRRRAARENAHRPR
jgi:exonuclease III